MNRLVSVPALVGVMVLGLGGGVMGGLLYFKRAPAEATVAQKEDPIHVEVQTVHPEAVPVTIHGFGDATALRTVTLSPEVSGRVTYRHPSLVVGGQVAEGEPLFTLDRRPFEVEVAGAEAELALQETARARLDVEAANLRQELASQKRNSALAEAHYERTKALHDEGVGSQANVDEAERTWLIARNETDRLARELKLFPLRQREAESAVARAQAQCDTARLALSRTEVVAPFTGRVKAVQIEEGETVVSGASAVTLVDDSVLEIAVPLNSVDARQWLQFESGTAQGGGAWFGHLKRVGCTIHWTEGDDGGWEGVLDRVAEYDPESRTVTVVVRVSGEDRMGGDRFPLVEGMFCKVSIPGRVMAEVYRLAPHVVSFENTVYVARGTRLKTVPVEVLRMETDYTYVSRGLEPGDRVITTRLVNPLDNALLAIDEAPREEPES